MSPVPVVAACFLFALGYVSEAQRFFLWLRKDDPDASYYTEIDYLLSAVWPLTLAGLGFWLAVDWLRGRR